MRTLRSVLLALAAVGASLYASAEQPTAELRAATDHVMALLRDPALQTGANKSERRQLMRKQLDQSFDWATVARSSLGRHWAKLTRAQQAEFVALVSRFLRESLIDDLETHYDELDKIEYLSERIVDDCASLKLQITTKDQIVHPIEYRLRKSGQTWRIYDALLEGVSLIKNYRDQFDEILSQSSYAKLVADIQAKIAEESH